MTAVIILHYNRIDLTKACVMSLVGCGSEASQQRIVVVDNASEAHPVETLVAALPLGVEVIRLANPAGFAGGMNAGIRAVIADPRVDSVLLLNNDTQAPLGFLEKLRTCLATSLDVGVVGCEMEGIEGGASQGARMRLAGPFAIPQEVNEGDAYDYLQGACLLIRRAVLETVGLLDESFYFFAEDADYSIRVRKAGWQLRVATDVRLAHLGSATIRTSTERQAAWYRAGMRQLLVKNYTYSWIRACIPFLYRIAVDCMGGRWAAVRGNMQGFFHRNLAAEIRLREQPFSAVTYAIDTLNWGGEMDQEFMENWQEKIWAQLQLSPTDRFLILTTRENHDAVLARFLSLEKVFILPTGLRSHSAMARLWGQKVWVPYLLRRYGAVRFQ